MENIASKCDEKYQKIENWFKHKRRIEVKRGLLKFEVKFFIFFKKIINFLEKTCF